MGYFDISSPEIDFTIPKGLVMPVDKFVNNLDDRAKIHVYDNNIGRYADCPIGKTIEKHTGIQVYCNGVWVLHPLCLSGNFINYHTTNRYHLSEEVITWLKWYRSCRNNIELYDLPEIAIVALSRRVEFVGGYYIEADYTHIC